MVLVIHAGAEIYQRCPLDSASFGALNFISTLVRGSVPVFFMLSGALLLPQEKLDLRQFLKKHVLYLTGIFFLWSLIYALGERVARGSFGSAYDFFMSVATGHYHMWFLPAMVLCYLFMPPVVSAIHGSKLNIGYLLFLFALFGLLWTNLNLTPKPAYILNRLTLNLDLNDLPYLGYAIWGYWLSTKSFPKRTLWLTPLIFLLCSAAAAAGNRWYSGFKGEPDGWMFNYFSFASFIQASCIFCFFSALGGREFKHGELIRLLSDCTLGVYLIHPLILNLLGRFGLSVSSARPVLTLLGVVLLLAAVCFALVAIVWKIPLFRALLFLKPASSGRAHAEEPSVVSRI